MTRRYLLGLGIAVAVVAIDLWTKRYAALHFDGDPLVLIPGFLEFTYVENPGGAFGSFPGGGTVIAIAAIVVTIVVRGRHRLPDAGCSRPWPSGWCSAGRSGTSSTGSLAGTVWSTGR